MHRDRPFDGSTSSSLRESVEVEADKFATYFLMPEKVVRKAFKQMYRTDLFYLSEETMFAFASSSTVARAEKCKTLRDLSRILASIECYNGLNVISLACQFGVSTEAMAIRLEELGLLEISDY